MPLPDPLATVYVVYTSDLKGPFVVTLHYFQVGTFTVDQAAADSLADIVDSTVGANLRDVIAADCDYVETVANINTGGVVYTGRNNTSAGAGSIAGQSMPDYVAAVIQKRTNVGGKTGRGRWYIGCVAEASNDTGRVELGALGAYSAWATVAMADRTVGGNTWRSGHLSRKDNTCVPIVANHVTPNFGTRRKRLLRSL